MSTQKANRSTTRSLRASGQPLTPSEAQKTPSSDPASGDSLEVIPTSNYNGHQQLSVFPSDELGAESHPLHSARDIPSNSQLPDPSARNAPSQPPSCPFLAKPPRSAYIFLGFIFHADSLFVACVQFW